MASDRDLPELQTDHSGQNPQVWIRTGSAPGELTGKVSRDGRWQWNGQHLLLSIAGVARFLITAAEIRVDAEPDADPETVRVFLLGSAWAGCCHQRDVLILHASAAAVGDAGLALMGNSGAGKSTLAALLAARGHCIAADDTCVLSSEAGVTHLQPASPRLKLWRDALPILAEVVTQVRPMAQQPGKLQLSLPQHWQQRPLRMQFILQLDDDQGGSAPRFERLSSLSCMRAIAAHTFRPNVVALLGRQQQNFALIAAVAATTEVYRWIRPWGIHRQHDMMQMLQDWLDSVTPARCMQL